MRYDKPLCILGFKTIWCIDQSIGKVVIKDNLLKLGYTFKSQTDTEVLVCLINYHLHKSNDNNKQDSHNNMLNALLSGLHEVRGSFGLALLNLNEPSSIYAARFGSPLVME